jgi:polyisoprenoid-binding protein YceI
MNRLAIAALAVLAAAPLGAATYTLEPNYTQAVFRWDHLGFSSPAAQVSQGAGTLQFDEAAPLKSSVVVTIPLSTLNTGVPDLDEHLRSQDFFNLAMFPTANFKSTKVEKSSTANKLKVTGDLQLHGVTKSITLEIAIVKVGTNPRTGLKTVGFDATTMLKRSDFGLGKYVPQVGDAVELRIVSQAVDEKGYADYLKKEAAAQEAAQKK